MERPYFILGNGSNLLVGDKGYRGVIIRLGGDFNHLTVEGTLLTAGASVLLSAAARAAMETAWPEWNLPPAYREAWAEASR